MNDLDSLFSRVRCTVHHGIKPNYLTIDKKTFQINCSLCLEENVQPKRKNLIIVDPNLVNIENNLTSTNTNAVLSAAQGSKIKELISSLDQRFKRIDFLENIYQIKPGDDLNKIDTIGNYCCVDNKFTKDIKNKPEGLCHAFIMTVGSATGNPFSKYLYQEIIEFHDGHRWYRFRNNTGPPWYGWNDHK